MSDENEQPVEIMRADPARKRQAWLLIAALVAAGVLLKFVALPALLRWLAVSDNALLLHRVSLVFYGMAATMLAAAAYAGWHASRILRSNQSPPPGTWLLRDTRIVRGTTARLRGWVVTACAAAFVVLAVYAAVLPMHLRNMVAAFRPASVPAFHPATPQSQMPMHQPHVVPHPHPNQSSLPIAKPHG